MSSTSGSWATQLGNSYEYQKLIRKYVPNEEEMYKMCCLWLILEDIECQILEYVFRGVDCDRNAIPSYDGIMLYGSGIVD